MTQNSIWWRQSTGQGGWIASWVPPKEESSMDSDNQLDAIKLYIASQNDSVKVNNTQIICDSVIH